MSDNSSQEILLSKALEFYNGKSVKALDEGSYPVYGSNGPIGRIDSYKYSNALIIGRVGAYCGSIEYCRGKFWASDNTIVATTRNDKGNVRYFYYLLKNMNLNRYAGGSAQPLLTQTTLRKLSTKMASPAIQDKVAFILSRYDDLIENNIGRIKILENMAQLIYKEWFVKFRFPGHEKVQMVDSGTDLGMIPEGWKPCTLRDVAEVNVRSIRKGNAPDRIRYIDISSVSTGRIENIEEMSFDEAPSRARRVVKHGDIIWSSVRPNRRSYSIVLDPPGNLIVSTGFAVISPQKAPFTYLYHCLTTDEFAGYLTNRATGAAYPAVNADDFRNALIIVPSESMMSQFHDTIKPLFLLNGNFDYSRKPLLYLAL